MTQLLTSKNAIIYGGGGDLGRAVALTFAREGAAVFLAGRTLESLERVAAEVREAGGRAEVAVVDATDERAVDEHADAVAAQGGIHVSISLIHRDDSQGTPLIEMSKETFVHSITMGVTSTFLTARAAARHMVEQGSGVILGLTSGSSRGTMPLMGNTGPRDAAEEAFLRYLAAEVGPHGVRVAGIHTAAVRETLTREKMAAVTGGEGPDPEAVLQQIGSMAMLRRTAGIQEVADTAAFLASDRAGAITSGIVNVTCGLVAG
jgi:NAD(P)-dependent dehydrogenase (short-subunit alcohol dehydrogenase family)